MLDVLAGARRRAARAARFVPATLLSMLLCANGELHAQRSAESAPAWVNGVLVKFRDAPAHDAVRKAALSAAARAGPGSVAAHAVYAAHELRVRRTLQAAGLAHTRPRPLGRDALHLQFAAALDAAAAERHAERLRRQPEVEWAVPNARERRLHTPDDPLFAATPGSTGQWWLHPVRGSNGNVLIDRLRGVPGLQSAWSTTNALVPSTPVVVAVLDTGVTPHADLEANLLPGYDFVSTVDYAGDGDGRDADPADPGDFVSAADKARAPALYGTCAEENSSWHGTKIAGVVAAVTGNAIGVASANGHARIVPVRVAGKCGADLSDILDGMHWAAGEQLFDSSGQPLPLNPNPAKVVNISFGGTSACSQPYQDAIDALAARGVVVVAAAGNEHGAITRPSNCDRVVGVAAVNRDGFKAHYSNFGTKLAIATVGGDPFDEGRWGPLLSDDGLLTVDNFGTEAPDLSSVTYSRISGTSFAAPIAAGVISLMLTVNPNLSVPQIISGLKVAARPHVVSDRIGVCSAQNPGRCLCTTSTCGAGLLDAEQAVLYAQDPGNYAVPNRPAVNIDSADVTAAVALGLDRDPNSSSGGGSGGGASSPAGLFGLAVLTLALARRRR